MARKRTPRIVGVRKKPTRASTRHLLISERRKTCISHEKTKKDKVYDIIAKACCFGYRFTDPYYGIPFIEPNDLEEKENGIYVIRFRCEPRYLHKVHFGSMAEDVCKTLRSGIHFIHEYKTEWGLSYEECVWVLQVGEQDNGLPIWRKIFMSETTIKGLNPEDTPRPRKCTHIRWEEFLQAHYNRSLLSVAQELGYSEQNLDILGGDFSNGEEKKRIYKKHKKLFDDFLADERNKGLMDGRKVFEYFKDLIASWIGEDLLVKALNEYGFNASVANADSDRKIKTNYIGVTGEPDIKIEYEGNTRYLELMDALSPVETYGQFDMRLSKAKNQFICKNLFLLHGLADGKYILIDFLRDNVTVTYNYPNPRFGNKACSVVRLQENGIQMQEMALFWESLKDIMRNKKPEPERHYLKLVDYKTGEVETLGNDGEADESVSDIDESDSVADTEVPSEEEPERVEAEEDSSAEEEQNDEPIEEEDHQDIEQTNPADVDEPEDLPEQEDIPQEEEEYNVPEETEVVEQDPEEEDGEPSIAYTPEQWEALNDVF